MARKNKFPVFAVLLLLLGIVWALQELAYLTIDVPWLPVILIVIAIGMIFDRFKN